MEVKNEQEIEETTMDEAVEVIHPLAEEVSLEEPNEDISSVKEEPDPESEEFLEETETPKQKPALTINIQSWATPVVGLLMLVVGLLGGFYGRPYIIPEATPAPTAAAPTTGETGSTNPQPNSASPENREAFVAEVVSRVRHFRGDPNAPITLIEFSDFQ